MSTWPRNAIRLIGCGNSSGKTHPLSDVEVDTTAGFGSSSNLVVDGTEESRKDRHAIVNSFGGCQQKSVNENRPLPNRCDYCTTTLDPSLSFCPRCAKPYKAASLALPLTDAHVHENDEVRIRKRAPQAINLFFWFLSVLVVSSTVAVAVFGTEEGPHVEVFVQVSCTCRTTESSWHLHSTLPRRARLAHRPSRGELCLSLRHFGFAV